MPDLKPMATCLPPDAGEIQNRLNRVQRQLQTDGVDALVAYNPDNIYYLTHFANMVHERPFVLVIPASGTPTFVMPLLEQPHIVSRAVGVLQFAPYREFPAPAGQGWSEALADVLQPYKHLAVESDCPQFIVRSLHSSPVIHDAIDEARIIKSDYEIARHRHASGLMMLGMEATLKASVVGAMPLAVLALARGQMFGQMMTDLPSTNLFATTFNAGPQPQPLTHDPHNFTDLHSPLSEGGPHIALSAGKANGYGAEVERTFFLGHIPEAAKRPFETMLQARAMAYELAVPGASMHDVDASVNGFLRDAGYGDALLHRTGHGFGVTAHEAPFLAEGEHRQLQAGMVLSIEPGIYLPGLGGFRHSDTVLITEQGPVNLTPWPDDLDALTL